MDWGCWLLAPVKNLGSSRLIRRVEKPSPSYNYSQTALAQMLNFDLSPQSPSFFFLSFLLRDCPKGNREELIEKKRKRKDTFSHHPPLGLSFAYTKNSSKQRPNRKKAAFQRAEAAGFLIVI